ncbi:MAG: permease-like cell division protein FtsX [Bacteroidota bacterium]
MAKAKDRAYPDSYLRKRSRSAYVTTLLSIALVLFFLGLFVGLGLYGSAFARYARSSLAMQVFLFDGIGEEQRDELSGRLEAMAAVRSVTYVSKEAAGEKLMERTGVDVDEVLGGVNPIPHSFQVQFHAAYAYSDSLPRIREAIEAEVIVAEVSYPLETLRDLNDNLKAWRVIIIVVGLLLIGIALYLIFGTIRLAIYAQRLTIRSMQLIGATRKFIRKPFVWRGVWQGSLAGLVACLLLILTYSLLFRLLQGWGLVQGFRMTYEWIGLLGGIILFGLLLGWSGSYFAVNRYLNKNLDELM